jgi:predicted aldo/keto reductase-like oxidoreductase
MVTMVDSETLWRNWAQESIQKLKKYRRDGRIGFIGLSNHNLDVARMAVQSGLIDVLMFPVNLYQHHGNQERADLLDICYENQVGVVAMKPYYGGRLISTQGRRTGITPIQCLQYALSQPISTTVPGPQNVNQFRQALEYLNASEEEKRYTPIHDELTMLLRGQCVNCKHCLPCPQEIQISNVIWCLDYVEFYGHGVLHDEQQFNRKLYSSLAIKASDCIECEVCLERCPFEVDIIGKMRRAVEVFETT